MSLFSIRERFQSFWEVIPIERRWFFQFYVSVLICINNGACFCFGIFSPFMKEAPFSLTQAELNVIGTAGVVLSYFSLPTGFIYDRYGPKVTLLVGAILNAIGWIGMYFIFKSTTEPYMGTTIWPICIFYGISQLSASFFETGSVLTNLDSFSCYQGRVILIQKTFMGLGSSVIAQIYVAFFVGENATISPFFMFLLIYSFSVGILGTIFIRLPTSKTRCLGLNVPDDEMISRGGGESTMFDIPFNVGSGLLLLCIAFILIVTIIQDFMEPSDVGRYTIGSLNIALCIVFVVMIIVTPTYAQNRGGYQPPAERAVDSEAAEPIKGVEDTRVPSIEESLFPPAGIAAEASIKAAGDEGHKTADREHQEPGYEYGEVTSLHSVPGRSRSGSHVGTGGMLRNKEHGGSALYQEDFELCTYYSTQKLHHEPVETAASDTKGWGQQQPGNISAESEAAQQEVKLNSRSLWRNLRTRELWLMWYVCFAVWSAATVVSTNSTQIYQAMDFENFSLRINTVFVSIAGVASAIGRVVVGVAHPFLVRKKVPIAIMFTIAPLLNVLGMPLFLFMPRESLFLPFFIVGFANGVSWGSVILIIKALFVPNNCGKHYSMLYTSGIFSPLVFNIGLFGPIYDHFSRIQNAGTDLKTCAGRECIWVPLVACACVNLIAFPLSVYLFLRVKRRGGIA